MIAELISVGTELLLGNIVNTNARYLSEQCAGLGIHVYYEVTVGDNEERLTQVIRTALERSRLVILTGGLGPTEDDLTREAAAGALGLRLVEDPHTRERIEAYFRNSIHKTISPNNWKQAQIIEGAEVLDNENGTAPGLFVHTRDGKHVVLLPGPPNELIPMFETKVLPILSRLRGGMETLYSCMAKICGIGESMAETMVKDLIDSQTNPTIATYAKSGEVDIRITAFAENEEEGIRLTAPVVNELKKRFGDHIYTFKEKETLEAHVVGLLKELGFTVTAAESCTGGLLCGRLVNVPGASAVLKSGFVTYADEAKEALLGVRHETLAKYGAVSRQTAEEMAAGAAAAAGADAAVSITGIAGPDGGTKEKPVGTVYIACRVKGTVRTERFLFKGNREKIRELSVQNALNLLRLCLSERKKAPQEGISE